MKTLSVLAVKLLPLLLFLNLGGGNSFAISIPIIEQKDSSSTETIKSAHPVTWAIRENLVFEFSDPSENHFFGSTSGKDHFLLPVSVIKTWNHYSQYKRDLRKHLSGLTFPTHFFL